MATDTARLRKVAVGACAAGAAALAVVYVRASINVPATASPASMRMAWLRVGLWAFLAAVPWLVPPHRLRAAARIVSLVAFAAALLLLALSWAGVLRH